MALSDDLVGYWSMEERFDEAIWAVNSVPPNSSPLATVNDPIAGEFEFTKSVAGKIGLAAEGWEANTSSILRADEHAITTLDRNKTFAVWVRAIANKQEDRLLGKVGLGTEYRLRFGSGLVWRLESDTQIITYSIPATLLEWHLVFFWFDLAAGLAYIRVDDGPVESGTFTVALQSGGTFGAAIGAVQMDELGIWNRILTAPEMAQLYNGGEGMSYAEIVADGQEGACREAECCEDEETYVSATGSGKGFNSSCEPLPKVIFEPPSGSRLILPSLVLLRSDNPDAVIHYTLDGSAPDSNSAIYSTALTVENPGTVIRAIAVVGDCPYGPEATAQYQTWSPSAHFTYACTTTDRSGQWAAFAANGSPDYNWELQIQFTAITSVKRFDVLQLFSDGSFTGSAWSTKEFITPWEDDIAKLHRAFPLVIWIGGVQQNLAYTDDYSASYGTFAIAAHTLEMHGQPWTSLGITDVFKLLVTFSDGTTVARIVDSTCDALPLALCPIPAFTLLPACAPYRIDVTFSLGVGTTLLIGRRVAGSGTAFDVLFNGVVSSSPQTFQDLTVAVGQTYEYFIANQPALCSQPRFSEILVAQSILPAIVGISVSPGTIDSGGSATVSWTSQNNNGTVNITPTIGVQPGNVAGSQVVGPVATTVYTITGQNACGSVATDEITLNVRPPASCGGSPPAIIGISGYFDGMFVDALNNCINLGRADPSDPNWVGYMVRLAPGSCSYELNVHQSIVGRLIRLRKDFTFLQFTGGNFVLELWGMIGATPTLVWGGTKGHGTDATGVYTRTGGCATSPTTVTIFTVAA